jgi:L-alanine-DL-glutamate epimerase-like enolase superfamily enzyme
MEIIRVRVPFRAPFQSAARTWTARDSWLVKVTGDDGTTGWGEAVLEDPAAAPAMERLVARVRDAADVPTSASLEAEGTAGRALLAALAGAATKQGADARPGAPGIGVNAVIGVLDRERAAEEAAGRVAAGFRTIKLKAGAEEDTAALVARVTAVRATVGDAVALRLDANGTWDLAAAVAVLTALDDLDLQYVEQPLAAADLEGLVTLRRRVGVPVAADEAVESVEAVQRLLDHDAADVLVVKPARVGGTMAVARIESLATARGVPVVVSSLFETGIGLAAALACASWVSQFSDLPGWPAAGRDHGLATADLLEDDLLVEPLRVEGGRMWAPSGAGSTPLGVAVDEAAVERYRVRDA